MSKIGKIFPKIMGILTIFLCLLVLIATALPLIDSAEWWIRIFDFPRVQISILTFLAIIMGVFFLNFKRAYKLSILSLLTICLVYQIQFIVVYTPLYTTQAKDTDKESEQNALTLLVSNVRMENEDKARFQALVKNVNPDVLLITEPDQSWANAIVALDKLFPYSIKYPLENTYGMILLSKLELTESAVNFLVKDSIPSIFTKITLPSGSKIDFYGVHPEPPMPGTDTYERDTELLLIGEKIRESKNPTMVAGDLNDVGWSGTSKLFRKYSKLVDPRQGRGFFNTYSVSVPMFRYPLDHIFYSEDFGLISLSKLEDIGSDHFPIVISLNYEPNEKNTKELKEVDAEEKQEVEKKIEAGN